MDALERLAIKSSFDPITQCINWNGAVGNHGYGILSYDNHLTLVHRLAAKIFFGFLLDPKLVICHKCDNKKCWNPMHLFIGTIADNNRDMRNKGRARGGNSFITHCQNGHEFTSENTLFGRNGKKRICKTCNRKRSKDSYARLKNQITQN